MTLIWRATAGRLWVLSMMKSWPFGLREIAPSIADARFEPRADVELETDFEADRRLPNSLVS